MVTTPSLPKPGIKPDMSFSFIDDDLYKMASGAESSSIKKSINSPWMIPT